MLSVQLLAFALAGNARSIQRHVITGIGRIDIRCGRRYQEGILLTTYISIDLKSENS